VSSLVDVGGAKGTRTPDPLLAKQVLFQLSYSPGKPAVLPPTGDPSIRRQHKADSAGWHISPTEHVRLRYRPRVRPSNGAWAGTSMLAGLA
jgi:hypothetical protein